VEEIFQVSGALDGPAQMPDGNFVLDDAPWTQSMQRFSEAGKAYDMPVCKQRRALGRDGLASSINLLLPDAEKTGRLISIANAVVRVDGARIRGSEWMSLCRLSRREMSRRGSWCWLQERSEMRLLLELGCRQLSGLVGRYLMDQIYGPGVRVRFPKPATARRRIVMVADDCSTFSTHNEER
jgi:hypothetical protein